MPYAGVAVMGTTTLAFFRPTPSIVDILTDVIRPLCVTTKVGAVQQGDISRRFDVGAISVSPIWLPHNRGYAPL